MLTFRELKKMAVIPETGAKFPTAGYLRECGVPIVAEKRKDGVSLTAYRNGYAHYCVYRHSTIFPFHLCGNYLYECNCKTILVPGQFFEDKEWFVRLILEGEDRLSKNQEVKEQRRCISYHSVSEEWESLADRKEPVLERMIKREAIEKIMETLTRRQRRVIYLYYFQRETQREIANELGISRATVAGILAQAVRKMQNGTKGTDMGKDEDILEEKRGDE